MTNDYNFRNLKYNGFPKHLLNKELGEQEELDQGIAIVSIPVLYSQSFNNTATLRY